MGPECICESFPVAVTAILLQVSEAAEVTALDICAAESTAEVLAQVIIL